MKMSNLFEVPLAIDALLKCVISSYVCALHENCRIGIQTVPQCRTRAVHVSIEYIFVHKCDCTYDMDKFLLFQGPSYRLK